MSQGAPPKKFVQRLRRMLSRLVKEQGDAIEEFDGDAAVVPEAVHSALQTLQASATGTDRTKNEGAIPCCCSA